MVNVQAARLRELLERDDKPFRGELIGLIFDAIAAQEVGGLIDRVALREGLYRLLVASHTERLATRHVLPAFERIAATARGRPDPLRSFLSPAAEAQLTALVQRGQGPRFGWMRGAVDPDDVQKLLAPIVQQLLMQFTSKLPMPGLGGGGGSAGGLGGLVGRIGKQVQKSAGQLADVGRQMLGGVVRDFSQTAMGEFRIAFGERVRSDEGQQILARMRDRLLSHVLSARLDDVVQDLMRLPRPEIARVVTEALAHGKQHTLFRALVEGELDALIDELGARTVGSLLAELGELDGMRAQVVTGLDPALRTVIASPAFADWLTRLLADTEAEQP
jgi:hypothetical protein